MSLEINGQTYYQTSEALKQIGISRTTFYRWLRENKIRDAGQKDRNGKRLFSENDIQRIKDYTETIIPA